ncbi:MAG: sulfotransferase [Clostridia bacterium]|nr:sulfotransferase [Clostridia bacterium]
MEVAVKPNCIIIGAAKSGTTYLFNLLSQHPDICVPLKKELTFFTGNCFFNDPAAFLARQYAHYSGEKIILDNTPEYLLKSGCARSIRDFSGPDTKLVCILRNPVDRAFSHYHMLRIGALEDKPFLEAITDETESINKGRPTYRFFKRVPRDYVRRGLYIESLEEFLKYFDKSNFHIIIFEEFIKSPFAALKRLLEFLGIDADYSFDFDVPRNEQIVARTTPLTKPINMAAHLFRKLGVNISNESLVRIRKLAARPSRGARIVIDDESKAYLREYYNQSIRRLAEEFSLDLSIWENLNTSISDK